MLLLSGDNSLCIILVLFHQDVLRQVLLEHSRPEVRAVGAKLLATKQGAK